jgi:hypothetical protein
MHQMENCVCHIQILVMLESCEFALGKLVFEFGKSWLESDN